MSIVITSTTGTHNAQQNNDQQRTSRACEPQALRSEDLLQGQVCVPVLHHGMRYLLRQTRQGKLILTK